MCVKSTNSQLLSGSGQLASGFVAYAYFLLAHTLITQTYSSVWQKVVLSQESQIVKWPLPTCCQWRQVPGINSPPGAFGACAMEEGGVRSAWYSSNEKCLILMKKDWRSFLDSKLKESFHFCNLGSLTTRCILSCFPIVGANFIFSTDFQFCFGFLACLIFCMLLSVSWLTLVSYFWVLFVILIFDIEYTFSSKPVKQFMLHCF